ncbi:PilW family protein [Demequina subtropica]|uniref:PilW family protein n=1 Tax=Demequina subtropica TaxID=1638989 RepID=UPI000783E0FC|nr:type II secretion system protein [Demequina subtropica]
MRRQRQAARRLLRDDSGMTLTELLVAMMIFGVLMAIVMAVMIQLMQLSKDNMGRVSAAENARLGVSQIDRQVRSGNVILDPALESLAGSGVDPYYSLRIFTQADGDSRCVQWRVIDADGDGSGELQYREWDPSYPVVVDVQPWGVVAHDVVLGTGTTPDPTDPATWPPFWKDTTTMVAAGSTPAQNVRITLHVKNDEMRDSAKPVTVSTVVTGRNTVLGYSESNCSVIPAP